MLATFVIAVIAALAIIGFCLYVNARPDSFRLERSTSINAAPEQVFALINDFREWSTWCPWKNFDPVLKRTFSGPGTVFEWSGQQQGWLRAHGNHRAARAARAARATMTRLSPPEPP